MLLCTNVAAVHVLLDPGHEGLEPHIHGGVVDPSALRHVAPTPASQAQQNVSARMLVTYVETKPTVDKVKPKKWFKYSL